MSVIVRFAPSPTGIPHVGGMRTVLFNYFFAKAGFGKFILRIEDTDQARKVEGAVEAIEESLMWLGVAWDEYEVQSKRLSHYKKYAEELVSKGKAREDDGAIRFNVPKEGATSWIDAVGNKKIEFLNSEIEDFIILKKDGFPTYHLANVVDDHLMNISHVIRGDDWIPSAPKHIMLYQALGWKPPVFAHVPNVLGSEGRKKLSKRHGAKSALDYKKEGILSDALVNYLMLLGWTPKNDREILTTSEIIQEFKLEDIHTAPAIFDERKLLWMNGEYIRAKSDEDLINLLKEFNKDEKEVLKILENRQILSLTKTRMNTLVDFKKLVTSETTNLSGEENKIRESLLAELEQVSSWNKDEIFSVFKIILDKYQIRMPVLYKIFTGKETGLPLPDFLEALGKDVSLARIR